MFTIKFYAKQPEGTAERIVSARHFDVFKRSDQSIQVTADDIEYQLSPELCDWRECYVENMAGKTIAHYEGLRDPK